MVPILSDFLRIRSCVLRFLDKCSIADDRKHYTHAVTMFHKTLQSTSKRLEKIYYEHVLMPQINMVHTNMRNSTVNLVSLLVVMLITGIHPEGGSGDAQGLLDLAPDM